MKNYHIQGPQIHQFNNVQTNPIPRSAFRRDYPRRMPFDVDYLYPMFVDEILPGDDVNIRLTALTRLSTPVKPVMDNLYQETFWFFVPYRLVWDNWEKFQGEQVNPNDSTDYTIPVLDVADAPLSTTGFAVGSIYDYMNMPPLVSGIDNISALYNRGIDLIWNEWFRDENLQNSLTIQTGDGPDDPATYELRKRNARKDYFTSCLPWPQKGDAVTITIGGTVPVLGIGKGDTTYGGSGVNVYESDGTTSTYANASVIDNGAADTRAYLERQTIGGVNYPHVRADLGSASFPVNSLRQAALYQQILELDARAGTRYVESIYSRFGVISPDFRLQRPELIGQGSSKITVYAVPQTAATGVSGTPQGNLAAYGTGISNGEHGCRYSATEHGMIIGLINVRADLTYQQGLPRMYSRRTRLDFYEPLLNGLGEQAVYNKEIYTQGTTADEEVFGYQERFAEYRYRNAEIIGLFRSQVPSTLDVWHMSREFGSLPTLNSAFITEAVPIDRVLAVTSEPAFLSDMYFSYTHVRPMPIRSNPGIDKL